MIKSHGELLIGHKTRYKREIITEQKENSWSFRSMMCKHVRMQVMTWTTNQKISLLPPRQLRCGPYTGNFRVSCGLLNSNPWPKCNANIVTYATNRNHIGIILISVCVGEGANLSSDGTTIPGSDAARFLLVGLCEATYVQWTHQWFLSFKTEKYRRSFCYTICL